MHIDLTIMKILPGLSVKQIQNLNHPEDYFHGREKTPLPCPTNIILFHRSSMDELNGQPEEYFQHHRFVLIYCVKGSGHVLINEVIVPLHPGHFCLIFPYELHYFRHFESRSISWLFITFEIQISELVGTLQSRSWFPGEHAELLTQNLVLCWVNQRPGLANYLNLILFELSRSKGNSTPPRISSIFVRVNQILNKQPYHPWTIEEIAHSAGYSAGHLRQLFRDEVKMSIGRYVRKYRALGAARLLQTTGQRIGEIADKCGYESHYAFSRSFKNEMGLCPKSYRERMNNWVGEKV